MRNQEARGTSKTRVGAAGAHLTHSWTHPKHTWGCQDQQALPVVLAHSRCSVVYGNDGEVAGLGHSSKCGGHERLQKLKRMSQERPGTDQPTRLPLMEKRGVWEAGRFCQWVWGDRRFVCSSWGGGNENLPAEQSWLLPPNQGMESSPAT